MNANSIKTGNIIIHENKLWLVLKREHTMPGKGGAFIQVEMKDIINNTKLNKRFRSNEDVEKAFIEEKSYQYQYINNDEISLMNTETFETIEISKELLGKQIVFLQDEMELIVGFHENSAIYVTLPDTVTMKVIEAEAVVKGQTAASSYKTAKIENDLAVSVPPFIETGDKIIVKTQDGSYVGKAK